MVGEIIYINKKKGIGTLESEAGEKYFFALEREAKVEEGDKVRFEYGESLLNGLLGTAKVIAINITK